MFDDAWHEATVSGRRRLIPTRWEVGMARRGKIRMTRKRIAARKANGALRHDPAIPPGRARIRTVREEPSRKTPPGTRDVYEKIAS